MTNVTIPITYRPHIQTGFVFLSMFYDFEWRITGHAELDSDSIRFKHVGKDILYLPVYYMNEKQVPAGDPFYIDSDGVIHHLNSDSPDSIMSINAITPEQDFIFFDRMINGLFESSADLDFSETKVVHAISDTPEPYNEVKLKQPHACRYVRYKSPKEGWCNVSKITFYDAAEANNSWTGLYFGEEKGISTIQYSPRIIGIGIYEGHEYELFCWQKNGWKSMEKKTATEQIVGFSAPCDALFNINNNTLKKRGKVFLIKGNHLFFYN